MESTAFEKQFQWWLALYGENPTPEIMSQTLRTVTQIQIVEMQRERIAATRATKEDAIKLVQDVQVQYERLFEAERNRSLQAASARDKLTITMQELQSRLDDAGREKAEALDRLQDLREERGNCQAELIDTRAELMALTEALQQCQDELRVVSRARDVSRAEVREQGATITMLSAQLQARENYINVLQKEVSAACAQLVEREHSSHQVTEKLKGQLEMERRGRADLYAQWRDCETRLEQQERNLSRMQAARDELHVQAGEQEIHVQSLETQLQLCQCRLAETVYAQDESHARAQASEAEVSHLTHQLGVLLQEHQDSVSRLETELEGTRAQCQQLRNELSQLEDTCSHLPVTKESSTTGGRVIAPGIFCTEECVYPVLLEPEAVLGSECAWSVRKIETPQYSTSINQGAVKEETSSRLSTGSAELVSDRPERLPSSWFQEELHPLGIVGIVVGWVTFNCLGGGCQQKERLSDFLQDCVHLWRGTDLYATYCSSTSAATDLLLACWTRGAACLLPRDYGPVTKESLL